MSRVSSAKIDLGAVARCYPLLALRLLNAVIAALLSFLLPSAALANPSYRSKLAEGRVTELSAHAMPINELSTKAVLHRLAGDDLKAFLGFTPKILISHSLKGGAFAIGRNKIVLQEGLAKFVRNEGELAFVIAHELSHHLLGHTHSNLEHFLGGTSASLDRSTIESELAADELALKLTTAAGYQPDAGHRLLSRIAPTLANNIRQELDLRIASLEQQNAALQ